MLIHFFFWIWRKITHYSIVFLKQALDSGKWDTLCMYLVWLLVLHLSFIYPFVFCILDRRRFSLYVAERLMFFMIWVPRLLIIQNVKLHVNMKHYDDVIMSTMASQITSLTIVYSTVFSGADQGKHQSSASLAFVRGIHRGPAQMASNEENVSIWWRHCGQWVGYYM